MKEHIYTIPINDAFDTDCECPICRFMHEEEKKLVDYTLGASMMEPDERERSNASGYCKHHFSMLLKQPNKLSLALILESHLTEIRKTIEGDSGAIVTSKKAFFGKDETVSKIIERYTRINDGCVICKKLDDIEDKFIDNIIELYKKEDEFRKKIIGTKGFCIPHFTRLIEHAGKVLSGSKLTEFYSELYNLEIAHLSRVQADITWFTKKFDFRFAKDDWKNSRDAVPRTVEKIIGYINKDDE